MSKQIASDLPGALLNPVPSRPEPEKQTQGRTKSPSLVQKEIWSILDGGVAALDVNDFGRPWPRPSGAAIAKAVASYPADLCLKAAQEAREIVQAQDRAPNITALFAKKLRDLHDVRDTIRKALEEN